MKYGYATRSCGALFDQLNMPHLFSRIVGSVVLSVIAAFTRACGSFDLVFCPTDFIVFTIVSNIQLHRLSIAI